MMNRNNVTLYVLVIVIVVAVSLSYVIPINISVEAHGMVRPEGEVIRVSSEASGRIVGVHGREGDEVHAGDTLVQLDTRDAELKQRMLENRIHGTEIRMQQLRPNGFRNDSAHVKLLSLYQELEQSELERARLTIVSPAAGLIGTIEALHPGEVLSQGTAIATIIPTDRNLIIESWLPARKRRWVHEGQSVRIQPDDVLADLSGTFEGIVVSISPDVRVVDAVPAYRVVVNPFVESPPLRLGMTFQIHFVKGEDRLLMVLFHRLGAGFER